MSEANLKKYNELKEQSSTIINTISKTQGQLEALENQYTTLCAEMVELYGTSDLNELRQKYGNDSAQLNAELDQMAAAVHSMEQELNSILLSFNQ